MSFEKDITEVKSLVEQENIFKAASPDDVANRADPLDSLIEDLTVLKDLFEENEGLKLTDSQWIKIIKSFLSSNSIIKIKNLEDLESQIMGYLVSMDDAMHSIKNELGTMQRQIRR